MPSGAGNSGENPNGKAGGGSGNVGPRLFGNPLEQTGPHLPFPEENLRREEEYGVRGQIFGNAGRWESGRCVCLERIRRIRVSPGPEHFVLGSNEIIPDGTRARMGTDSGNCAGKSSSPALGRGLRSSNLSVATPREGRRRRSRKNFHAESTSASLENETLRRRRRDENLGAAGIRHGASGTAGKTPGKTSRRAARRVRFPGADRWTRGK